MLEKDAVLNAEPKIKDAVEDPRGDNDGEAKTTAQQLRSRGMFVKRRQRSERTLQDHLLDAWIPSLFRRTCHVRHSNLAVDSKDSLS